MRHRMEVLQRITRSSIFTSHRSYAASAQQDQAHFQPQTLFSAAIQVFTRKLERTQPGFWVHASDIKVLNEPREFYALLLASHDSVIVHD
jgi:hypothetical protein